MKTLRTASLGSNVTGSYKKRVSVLQCSVFHLGDCIVSFVISIA